MNSIANSATNRTANRAVGGTAKKMGVTVYLIVFTVYLALLVYFLFFSDIFGRTVAFDEYRYNLKPFAEITRYFTRVKEKDYLMFFINIVGNIALFVPFGFLFPFVSEKRNYKRSVNFFVSLLVTVLFCVLIEGIQLVTKVGVFDVDDIIMNTFGSIVGYILHRMVRKPRKNGRRPAGQ